MSSPKLEYLLALDNTRFNRALKTSQQKVISVGHKMAKGLDPAINKFKTLRKMTAKVAMGGVVAGGALAAVSLHKLAGALSESVELAGIQEQAEAKLAAVINATGGAAGFTAAELNTYAGELQKITTYGDETTISAMAVLATFKQIKGDNFKAATKAAMDMSSVMGTDLQSSIVLVGKALNDPVKGLSALGRNGVKFTDGQKEMIESLIDSGDMLGAQAIILGELQGQFGGAAEAQRLFFGGMQDAANNALGDLKEEMGFAITKNEFFIEGLKILEAQFISWTETVKANGPEVREEAKQAALSFLAMGEGALTSMDVIYRGTMGVAAVFQRVSAFALDVSGGIFKIIEAGAALTDWLGITKAATQQWADASVAAFDAADELKTKSAKNFDEMQEGSTKIQAARDALEGFRKTMEEVGTEKVGAISKDSDSAAKSTRKFKEELVKVNGVWKLNKTAVEAAGKEVDSISKDLDKLDGRVIKVQIVAKKAHGGFAGIPGLAAGGSVLHAFKRLSSPYITSGSGLRDDVPALLKKREFVQPDWAVSKYGVKFMEAVRRGLFPVSLARGFAAGGSPAFLPPLPSFQSKPTPQTAPTAPTYNLNLTFSGNVQAPSRQNAKQQARLIVDSLRKMQRDR